MLTIFLVLLLTLLVGVAVLAYVAFPHRGEDLPVLPQAGHLVRKGVESLPVLEDGDEEQWLPTRR